MKLCYWNIENFHRPWSWSKGGRIVRVIGNNTPQATCEIFNHVRQYMDHTFLVFSERVGDFKGAVPINVLPVLQISHHRDLDRKLDDYFNLDIPYFCLDIQAVEYFKFPGLPVDWYFCSGSEQHYNKMRFFVGNVFSHGIPLYVEKYNDTRQVPREFDIRQIPESLEFACTHPMKVLAQ